MKILFVILILLLGINVGGIGVNTDVIKNKSDNTKTLEDIEQGISKKNVPDVLEGEGDVQEQNAEYKTEHTKAAIEYLMSIANNNLTADELIKTEYSVNMFGCFDYDLQTIMKKISAECVRMIDENNYYIIFKTQSEYLFLEFDFAQNSTYPVCIICSGNKLTLSDFDEISIGTSTKWDVVKIDPYGIYSTPNFSISSSSIHFTMDGYSIRCVYDDSTGPAKVYSIETKQLSHTLNEILLEQDKELLI